MCKPNANYPLFLNQHGLCFFQTINQYKQHPDVTRKGRKSRRVNRGICAGTWAVGTFVMTTHWGAETKTVTAQGGPIRHSRTCTGSTLANSHQPASDNCLQPGQRTGTATDCPQCSQYSRSSARMFPQKFQGDFCIPYAARLPHVVTPQNGGIVGPPQARHQRDPVATFQAAATEYLPTDDSICRRRRSACHCCWLAGIPSEHDRHTQVQVQVHQDERARPPEVGRSLRKFR
jgi:hypothetical protein